MSYDCVCDYDPPEFYCKTAPKARKQHKCEECCGPILPGEKYELVAGKWDGYFNTFKTCQRCVDLRTWVTNNIPCTCWAHGNMHEDLKESVHEAAYRAREETVGIRFGLLRRMVAIDKFNAAQRTTPEMTSPVRGPAE